jgi:lactate dehydrogenase-like 2-hydroxyacid dehydrogenase
MVILEAGLFEVPKFHVPEGDTLEIITYPYTPIQDLIDRIRPATLLLTTVLPLTAEVLSEENCPNLKLIQVLGTGYDKVDVVAAKKRGITVQNTPGGNVDSVAEHALALYFNVRRSSTMIAIKTSVHDLWMKEKSLVPHLKDSKGNPPLSLREEVACIIGFGAVGRRIAELVTALGMKVCVAERSKGPGGASNITVGETSDSDIKFISAAELAAKTDVPRTPLSAALQSSTTVFLACPLTTENSNLIGSTALSLMKPCSIIINVARGGVVDEQALAKALVAKQIAGAGADVFVHEPSSKELSPLLALDPGSVNFVASPHLAWFSEQTMINLRRILVESVDSFMAGKPVHVVS